MEIVSKKEETHIVSFTGTEVIELLTEMSLKKLGYDPKEVDYTRSVNGRGINFPKATKIKIKGELNIIPNIEITILNPVDRRAVAGSTQGVIRS